MEQNRLWLLMARKLSGEATAEELEELNALMRRYPTAHHTYEVLAAVWKKDSVARQLFGDVTAEERMEAVQDPAEDAVTHPKVTASLPPWEEKSYKREDRLRRMKNIFAFVCLAGFAGLAFYFHPHPASYEQPSRYGENEIVTRFGSKSKVLLPDGTQVWLNAGSKLTYPNDFSNAATRDVKLCGEAFFEVVHDAAHPFVIHTKFMEIRDLGTKFDVKAYAKDSTTEATLIAGSIEVFLSNDPSHKIVLKPNEKITFYNSQARADNKKNIPADSLKELKPGRKTPVGADIYKISAIAPSPSDSLIIETAWMENKLVFRSETFADLAQQMERWYNVKIRFKDEAVRRYIFTGVFSDETINQALDELRMIAPFQYTVSKSEVTIAK